MNWNSCIGVVGCEHSNEQGENGSWFASINITSSMVIGNRLKELRESKELSQGDIEKRTGLLRCYISRVENAVPAIETLARMARALEVPMYRLFHDGEAPASLRKMKPPKDDEFGSTGEDAVYLSKLCKLLAEMKPDDQKFLLHMAQKAARGSNRSAD
jgi:transcriptional regulator with XRE-family HTH domain